VGEGQKQTSVRIIVVWFKLLCCTAKAAKPECRTRASLSHSTGARQSHPTAAWVRTVYHPEFETAMTYLDQSRIAREEKLAAEEQTRNEEIERDKRELEKTKRSSSCKNARTSHALC
jgi:hypothetical protein